VRRRDDFRIRSSIVVFTGMIASTCLAVLFVPSFWWWMARKARPAALAAAE
jgi:multidrug efflux pump subunit AcrB